MVVSTMRRYLHFAIPFCSKVYRQDFWSKIPLEVKRDPTEGLQKPPPPSEQTKI